METSLILMNKLCAMLILVLIGIFLVRKGILSVKESRAFSAITVYVLQPALIIHAFEIELTTERVSGFLFGLAFSMIVYIGWIIAAALLKKPLHLDAIDQTTLIYSNCGNLTLPIVEMTLGSDMVFYLLILQIPFNLFIWTHGAALIGGKNGVSFKKIFLNTNVIALFIGIFIMVLGIKLPDAVDTTINTLSAAVPAVSMIVVGMVIGDRDLKEIITGAKAYAIVTGRLILFPAATMFLLYLSGILKIYPQYIIVLQIVFMGLCAPPASTVSQLAVLYDEKPAEASIYNTVGMFLCIITIPLMNLLYEVLFF